MVGIQEHPSVLGYHALKIVMASPELALIMAEMIFKNVHGEDYFKTELPLKLTDGGDRWIIEGSRKGDDYPVEKDYLPVGPVCMEILKANCQVLKLIRRIG